MYRTSSILIKYFIFKPLSKRGKKTPPKLDTIQAVLQTLNAKFQSTKIVTTIYSVCVCVCVNRSPGVNIVTDL